MTVSLVQVSYHNTLAARRTAMPIPIVCLDGAVSHWATAFRACFSKPQYQHFVTVRSGCSCARRGGRSRGCVGRLPRGRVWPA